jgi:glutamate synthase domain-containing protein 3
MVVLGINKDGQFLGDYLGSGMHGGVIYIRGDVDDSLLGRDVIKAKPDAQDDTIINKLVTEYCTLFGYDFKEVMSKPFIKLTPRSHRPYGNLYAK